MRRLISTFALLAVGLLTLACDSGGEDGDGETTATSTSAPTSAPPVDGDVPAEVSAVIGEVESGDAAALAARFLFQELACTDAPGTGQEPPCRSAGPPGTLVPAFPVLSCEQGWAAEAEPVAAHVVDAAPQLHSVLQEGERYHVVWVAPFPRDPSALRALSVTLEGGEIVAVDEGCTVYGNAAEVVLPAGDVVLAGPAAVG